MPLDTLRIEVFFPEKFLFANNISKIQFDSSEGFLTPMNLFIKSLCLYLCVKQTSWFLIRHFTLQVKSTPEIRFRWTLTCINLISILCKYFIITLHWSLHEQTFVCDAFGSIDFFNKMFTKNVKCLLNVLKMFIVAVTWVDYCQYNVCFLWRSSLP